MKYTAQLEFEKWRCQIKSNRLLDRLKGRVEDRIESIVRHGWHCLRWLLGIGRATIRNRDGEKEIAGAKFPAFLY